MPTVVARLRMEAAAAERGGDADKAKALRDQASALVLKHRRAAARKGRAVLAAAKAAEVLPEPAKPQRRARMVELGKTAPAKGQRRARAYAMPDEATLLGRIDLALVRMKAKRRDLAAGMGVSAGVIHSLGRRENPTMRPQNFASAAKFLGVTLDWLKHGGTAPAPAPSGMNGANGAALLLPHTATMFRAPVARAAGKLVAPGKLQVSLDHHLDEALHALWGTLPLDVKVFLLARVAELVAMKDRAR